ncbi:hypothetical protein N0V83_003871 [Neocucurbitaria cava]|uniref:Heterokaryon incompatibility domain-containing protein n=1 Tax=Neocucurbitaria cava TaxID=798079 RepID=A0A9W9CNI2_9PLEO|nr:hypothetical protein N0V83_003871 [Neocucurbitaria cava]
MRLLSLNNDGEIAWREFISHNIPPYAILSHTWDSEEVTFGDLVNGSSKTKAGYRKILFFSEQAKCDGLDYFWIDTCCIDKRSSAELSEAINSMFNWYQNAERCYVYLADVSLLSDPPEDWVDIAKNSAAIDTGHGSLQKSWKDDFRTARWFRRGWTLQELIAPHSLSFFSREGRHLGNKNSLEDLIHEITGIHRGVMRGSALSSYTVQERLSWAEGRQTTRIEDGAYCLLGIFDINMPLLYGEGDKAFQRIAEEIAKSTEGYKAVTNRDVLKFKAYSSERGIAYTKRILADLALEEFHEDENAKETNTRGTGEGNETKNGSEVSDTNKLAKRMALASSASTPPRDQDDEEHDESGHQDRNCGGNRPLKFPPSSRLVNDQLRIITLDGATIGDRLVGHVQTYNFSNAPAYYALSYTWGDEPDLHPISLNGSTRFIRSNLFHALQRIRLRSGGIHVWIDSICIRQEDEMEKKSQVKQMAKIYKNATGVMVWLGEKDSTSNLALNLIEKIVELKYSWSGADGCFKKLLCQAIRPYTAAIVNSI